MVFVSLLFLFKSHSARPIKFLKLCLRIYLKANSHSLPNKMIPPFIATEKYFHLTKILYDF